MRGILAEGIGKVIDLGGLSQADSQDVYAAGVFFVLGMLVVEGGYGSA